MENKSFWIRRAVYAVLIVLSLVFITFRGGNVPYMMFALLILNIVVSYIYIINVFYSLRVNQYIPEHKVDKNRSIDLKFSMRNEGLLSCSSVRMKFLEDLSKTSGSEELEHIGLEPKENIERTLSLNCRYSGAYYAGLDKIEVTDYFGIFRLKFDMPQKMKVVVRPRIIEVDSLPFLSDNEEFVNSSNFRQDESVVDNQVRAYISGDNRNLIHWRNSVKCQNLMVRTMAAEETAQYLIIIDGNIQADDYTQKVIAADKVREAAIAVINYLFKCGYSVNYMTDDLENHVVYDYIEFRKMYDRISEFAFLKNSDINTIIKNVDREWEQQTTIIVVSSEEKNIGDDVSHNIFWVDADEFLKG